MNAREDFASCSALGSSRPDALSSAVQYEYPAQYWSFDANTLPWRSAGSVRNDDSRHDREPDLL
jgi:hypothetical protein